MLDRNEPRQKLALARGGWVRIAAGIGLIAAFLFLAFTRDPLGTLTGLDQVRHRGHTDHVAHVGETRLFPRLGPPMWHIPALELFRQRTPAEVAALPDDVRTYAASFPQDVRFVPGYPPSRPLVMNYPHVPRVYPPGVYLFGAPSAALYHYGLISFAASNRLFLAVLAGFWFAGALAWTAWWRAYRPSLLRQVLTAVVAGYAWYWALEGFYDVAVVAVASLGLEAARREQHGRAGIATGLSVIMHPRLLMLLPLLAAPFVPALRSWRTLGAWRRAAVVVGALLFAAGLGFALLIQGTVALHAVKQPPNPVCPGRGPWLTVLGYAAIIVTLVVLLFREGSRMDALTVLFAGLAFGTQRYQAPWYWLPMLPWALSSAWPASGGGAAKMSRTAAVSRVVVVAAFFVASNGQRWTFLH